MEVIVFKMVYCHYIATLMCSLIMRHRRFGYSNTNGLLWWFVYHILLNQPFCLHCLCIVCRRYVIVLLCWWCCINVAGSIKCSSCSSSLMLLIQTYLLSDLAYINSYQQNKTNQYWHGTIPTRHRLKEMQVQHQTQLIQTSIVQTTVLCLTFELSDEHQSNLGQNVS